MKNFSKGKPQKIRKAHYLTSLAAFILAFGVLGVVLEFSSYASNITGTVVGVGGMCLDNSDNAQKSDNKIQLWNCNAGDPSQAWTVNGTTSTPGTIVNSNGYCLDIAGGETANYTNVVLFACDGSTEQNWYYNASTGLVTNEYSKSCLEDYESVTTDGSPIVIDACDGSTAQTWDYKLASSSTSPTTKTTLSNSSVSVTNSYAPPSSATAINQTTGNGQGSTATTKLNQTGAATSPSSEMPVISNLTVSDVTATSAHLTWHNTVGAYYTIKFGESSKNLSNIDKFESANKTITITLNQLQPNTRIYLSITPTNGTATGARKTTNFKTLQKTDPWITALLGLIVLLIIIGILIKSVGRKPVVPEHAPSSEELPVIPQENLETYNNRVNWWMPKKYRQTGLPKRNSNGQYHDMFIEGEKRLEEEEKEHRIPKE